MSLRKESTEVEIESRSIKASIAIEAATSPLLSPPTPSATANTSRPSANEITIAASSLTVVFLGERPEKTRTCPSEKSNDLMGTST